MAGLSRPAVDRWGGDETATVQADTPSVTWYGQYADQHEGPQPRDGYNQDGHPEGKPRVAGLVTRDERIPIAVDADDGNRDDPTGSRDALWSQGGRCPPHGCRNACSWPMRNSCALTRWNPKTLYLYQ
ncbi:MAG: hypothetical protein M0Z53_14265 [Thermaerobacter sp.]|nr:hypothetical protein [Thermaerobacter sp.]